MYDATLTATWDTPITITAAGRESLALRRLLRDIQAYLRSGEVTEESRQEVCRSIELALCFDFEAEEE